MIYVLEVPAQGESHAWFAFDDKDFARKVEAQDELQAWEIYDVTTARELLELSDLTPTSPLAPTTSPGIFALGQEHGWDTPLYRADYLLGRGQLQATPVLEREAYRAALNQRLAQCRIYWTDSEALAAFEAATDSVFTDLQGWRLRHALKEQLVALEILADDL